MSTQKQVENNWGRYLTSVSIHVCIQMHMYLHTCTEKEACRVEVLWKHLGSAVPAAVGPGSQFSSTQTVSRDSLRLLFRKICHLPAWEESCCLHQSLSFLSSSTPTPPAQSSTRPFWTAPVLCALCLSWAMVCKWPFVTQSP